MVICGSCQTSNSPKAKFCVKCGVNLRPEGTVTKTQAAEKTQPKVAPEQKATLVETKSRKQASPSLKKLADPDSIEGSIVSYVETGGQSAEAKIEPLAQIDTPAPSSRVVSDVGTSSPNSIAF